MLFHGEHRVQAGGDLGRIAEIHPDQGVAAQDVGDVGGEQGGAHAVAGNVDQEAGEGRRVKELIAEGVAAQFRRGDVPPLGLHRPPP